MDRVSIEQVLGGLEGVADDKRSGQIEDRRKQLVGACEGGRVGVRCTVANFYEGAQFFQIEQTELRELFWIDTLRTFLKSDWIAETFGAEFRHIYGQQKLKELRTFQTEVTSLEIDWYLRLV